MAVVSVYVDDNRFPYGRMLMSHLVADDEDELHRFAASIGMKRSWFHGDHYDVGQTLRAKAIEAGAIPMTLRWVTKFMVDKRRARAAAGRDNVV